MFKYLFLLSSALVAQPLFAQVADVEITVTATGARSEIEDTGQPVSRIFDDSLHDHWYTAAQAREYGFIDGIVDSFAQVMPARKHRIGLKGEVA